jgi:hypothetical protein
VDVRFCAHPGTHVRISGFPASWAALVAMILSACTETPSTSEGEADLVRVDVSAPPVAVTWQSAGCDAKEAETPCAIDGAEALHVSVRGTWRVGREGLWWQSAQESARLVARRGPGPGELIAPIAVGAADDTVLTAYDIARNQLVRYTPAGLRSEHAVQPPLRIRWAMVRHGRLLAYLTPPAASYDETVESAIVAFDPERNLWSDTLAHFADAASSLIGEESMHLLRFPWEARLRWDVCADGSVLLAVSDRWAVTRVRGRDTVQRFERAGALTDPLDASTLDAIISDWEQGPLRRTPEALRAGMRERARSLRVENRPVIESVVCGDAGEVVVAEAMLPADSLQSWVHVSADGRVQTRWSLPPVLLPQVMGEGLVGVLVEDGGERLVVARP